MDIKILHSWLQEYLETNATPQKIGECLALCGPSCERVTKIENDWVYEIEVTTNRVDMMSIYGIAREAAAILPQFGIKTKLKPLLINKQDLQPSLVKQFPLTVKTQKNLTNRVLAQVMEVDKIPPTPDWIVKRLEASEIRSINLLVDITNYVMLEVGHPTHVFDYDRIKSHQMIFRESRKGEKVTTLDDKTYTLTGGDSVIDDGSGLIIDLPGIMGTANSVVTNQTKRIIFFIDNNNGKLMRQTSMQHGIRTNAVTINEKNVSPELSLIAMQRGTNLYQQLCNAKIAKNLIDKYDNKPKTKTLDITLAFIEDKMGVKLDSDKVIKSLEVLGFKVKTTKQKYSILVPYWRTQDIEIPEDIVEEVARLYGYHNLPSVIPTGDFPLPNPQENNFYWEKVAKTCLKNWGYTENYNYSLISENLIKKVNAKPETFLKLKNPLIEDWLYLRKSLSPSLLQTLANNQDRVGDSGASTFNNIGSLPKQKIITNSQKNLQGINFFEMANVYLPTKNNLPDEIMKLAIISNCENSYFKVKGILESLAQELGLIFEFKKSQKYKILDNNIQAQILLYDSEIGYIGNINIKIKENFSLKKNATVAQIDFKKIVKYATKNKIYTPIPKFPPIIEDLTFFNNENIESEKILTTAKKSDKLVFKVKIKDFYQNKITLEISYLDKTKNLEAKDIIPIRKTLVKDLENLSLQLQGQI